MLRKIERDQKSRVITMIRRQEAVSLFGIPFTRYIDIEDSEQVLRAIRLTPDDVPIDIILHTPGFGLGCDADSHGGKETSCGGQGYDTPLCHVRGYFNRIGSR